MIWLIYVLQFLEIALLGVMALYLYYDWKYGVAAVPSSSKAIREVVKLVPDSGEIVDLGSGWGGMAAAVARAHPAARVVGIECALLPYMVSRLRKKLKPASGHLQFLRQNLFDYPLGSVAAVLCYMPPEMMARLAPKLQKELPPGALIISNSAGLTGLAPEKTVDVPGILAEKIFVYRIKGT